MSASRSINNDGIATLCECDLELDVLLPFNVSVPLASIDVKLKETVIKPSGRHDACVLPRAVPIVDALTAMTILDYYLLNKTTKLSDL